MTTALPRRWTEVLPTQTHRLCSAEANLIPFLTALENVHFALEINDVSRKTARAPRSGAAHVFGSRPQNQQSPAHVVRRRATRVAVARAWQQARLVLQTNRQAALDSIRGRQVMELFRTVAHEHGTTVLVATHDHRALMFLTASWRWRRRSEVEPQEPHCGRGKRTRSGRSP